jgi:preprotein translocase subunit SecG
MAQVLIAAYLLIVLALIGVILLQRSEGGALGIGGGSSFTQARSSGNILTRTTAILAVLFFATAIGLTIISELNRGSEGILERASEGGGPTSVLDALNRIGGEPTPPGTPAAPATTGADPALPVPATPVPATGPAAPATSAPAPATMTPSPEPAAPSALPEPAPSNPALPVPATP